MRPSRVEVPPALDGCNLRRLRADLTEAFADPHSRVVILRAASGVFCRGLDLVAALRDNGVKAAAAEFAACLSDIQLGPKPVIAVVNGAATGGGVGLAAAADLVIAAPSASFGLTELLFGLTPAIILPYLLERMTPATVRLWGLSGHTWIGEEARRAGLVDVVTEDGGSDLAAQTWARRMGRVEASAAKLWKRQTAESRPTYVDGATATAERLCDPEVLGRIRRFVEEEELPWMEAQ